MDDPRELTDAELMERGRLRPEEERLLGVGCAAAPLCSILLSYTAIALATGIPHSPRHAFLLLLGGIVPSIIGGLVLYLAGWRLVERRALTFQAELARRWGQADFSVYVEEARQGLRAPEGPQWEVLLRGGGPPETSYRLVRLTLREKQGVLESIRSHAVTSSSLKDGEATAETHRLELSGSRTKRVLKLLADLEPPLERAEAQPGRAALEIAVLRREPPLCSRGRLYPQDGDKELTATGRLAAEVLSLADEAPGAG